MKLDQLMKFVDQANQFLDTLEPIKPDPALATVLMNSLVTAALRAQLPPSVIAHEMRKVAELHGGAAQNWLFGLADKVENESAVEFGKERLN